MHQDCKVKISEPQSPHNEVNYLTPSEWSASWLFLFHEKELPFFFYWVVHRLCIMNCSFFFYNTYISTRPLSQHLSCTFFLELRLRVHGPATRQTNCIYLLLFFCFAHKKTYKIHQNNIFLVSHWFFLVTSSLSLRFFLHTLQSELRNAASEPHDMVNLKTYSKIWTT